MKRLALLFILMLGVIVVLPRWAAAQSTTEPSPEALQRFHDQLLAGDVQPLIDPSRPQPERQPVRMLAPQGDWAWVAFQSYRDGNWEIYLAHDGVEYRLTNHPSSDARPRLNRGTTQVVFNSNRDGNYEIYKMNVDGSGVTRLTADADSDIMPTWSPDGSQIAFASNRTGNYEIYVMNADGSGLRQLTTSWQTSDVSPSWSPDGTRLSYVQETNIYGAINTVQADGSGGGQVLGGQPYLSDAVWSPTGSRFAFDYIPYPSSFPAAGVYVVNADGSGLRKAFDSGNYWVDYYVGSWSPDGANIMYTRAEYGVSGGQIYLFYSYVEYNNADVGWSTTRVTWSGYDMNPDWQIADLRPPVAFMSSLPAYSHSDFDVAWSGYDNGPSGISTYDVQMRLDNGTWTMWRSSTPDTSFPYYGATPGQTFSFRNRARDGAGNLSPWSSAISTTIYTWQISGTVRDTRDYATPYASVVVSPTALAPITTDIGGNYRGYLKTSGDHQIAVIGAGYGTSTPLLDQIGADKAIGDLRLPPADELIDNGNFEEAGWGAWQATGDPLPQVVNAIKHTGHQAAKLGQPAQFNYTLPDNVPPGIFEDAITDRAQTTYLYGQLGDITQTYQAAVLIKPVTDTWSITPTILLTSTTDFEGLSLIPDELGGFHALWRPHVANDDGQLLYCHVASSVSGCSTPEVVTAHASITRSVPQLAVDRLGGVHVIWLTPGDYSLKYATKPQGGSWSAPETIVASNASRIAFGVDAELTVHVITSIPNGIDYIDYTYKLPDESWSALEQVGSTFSFNQFLFTVAPDDSLHMSYIEAGSTWIHYRFKPAHGSWRMFEGASDYDTYGLAIVYQSVSADGVVHLVYRSGYSSEMLNYRVRQPDGTWLRPADAFNIGSANVLATSDTVGVIHLLWQFGSVVRHTQTTVPAQPTRYALSQAVTIPANAHRPTLSLLYRAEDTWQLGANRLVAEIDNGTTISGVLSAPVAATKWSTLWVDVSDWTGQMVTVSLKLQQPSGSPPVQVYLDEASLGSWLTPLVTGISSDRFEAWTTPPITITGDNFVTTPTVQIGSTIITDVLWLDAQTLSLTPPPLAPGIHTVLVFNPGGQVGILAYPIAVGKRTYLPLMRR